MFVLATTLILPEKRNPPKNYIMQTLLEKFCPIKYDKLKDALIFLNKHNII